MNTINEMCLAWYMWVNGNYDILIMTITLIVVAGLVLEVVRLNRKIDLIKERADWDIEHLDNWVYHFESDQVKVNVHLAEDIAKLQELLSFRLKKIKTKSRAKK